MASGGAENFNANTDNVIFAIKDTTLSIPVITLSAKNNQNFSKRLSKDFEDKYIQMNIKQNVIIKIRQMSIDILSNQTL